MTTAHDFAARIAESLAPLPGVDARAFWQLLASGQAAGRDAWLEGFRELGIVHLLVLSGSQVGCLAGIARFAAGKAAAGAPEGRRRGLAAAAGAMLALVYAGATGWSPPIARATLVLLIRVRWPSLREGALCASALLLQSLAFPGHLSKPAFYMSWAAYFVVKASSKLGRVASCAVICACCQALACLTMGSEVPGLKEFLTMVSANLVAIPVFERLLFPAALPWIATGLGAPLAVGLAWSRWAGAAYAWCAEQLLVAVDSIRYIEGV